jgi:hypothetical protein
LFAVHCERPRFPSDDRTKAGCCFRLCIGLRLLQSPLNQSPIAARQSLVSYLRGQQVMLDKGQDADWFSSTFIRLLAAGAALGFKND